MLEKKQKWIIETTTRLYTNQRVISLKNSLLKKNEDYLAVFDNDEVYLLSVIDIYYRYFFVKNSNFDVFLDNFSKEFILTKDRDPVLFKAFDLYLYFEQRDRRNGFVFNTLLEDYHIPDRIYETYSYNPAKTLSLLKDYACSLKNNVAKKRLKRIISIVEKLLR